MGWEELGVQEAAVPSPSAALQASVGVPATAGSGAAAQLTPGFAPGCLESLEEERCHPPAAGRQEGRGKSRVKLLRQVSWVISEDVDSSLERH